MVQRVALGLHVVVLHGAFVATNAEAPSSLRRRHGGDLAVPAVRSSTDASLRKASTQPDKSPACHQAPNTVAAMRLLPRTEAFFDLLEEDATLLVTVAGELLVLAGAAHAAKESGERTEAILGTIDKAEARCAAITDSTVAALRVTFLTPLDRDDLFVLTAAIERAMSALVTAAHECARSGAIDGMPALARPGHAAVEALATALGKMRDSKHRDHARAACDGVRKAARESERARRTFARGAAEGRAGDALALVAARALEAAHALEAALLDA